MNKELRKEEVLYRFIIKGTSGLTTVQAILAKEIFDTIESIKKIEKSDEFDISEVSMKMSISDDAVRDATDKVITYCKGNLPITRDELFEALKHGYFHQHKPSKY